MKKVLVIGSNSFSGSDFIDLLCCEGKYRVIGVSRSPEKSALFLPYRKRNQTNFQFYQIDLNKNLPELEKLLEDFQPQYIVNFAAQSEVAPSWEFPEQWFQTNAVAITQLANLLKNKSWLQKYVHISSPEVYGSCSGLVREDAPLNPTTPYAASKAAGDLSLFTFYKNYNFPLVIIRATNVYGAHQQLFKIIPRSIISIKLNKKIELHGGGEAVKSYIHIRDVSRGEMLAMERGKPGEIYHLSPHEGVKVKEVVGLLCKHLQVSFEDTTVKVAERLGQDRAYLIDSSKMRESFDWKPLINLEEGLKTTIKWIQTDFNEIVKKPLGYIHKR